jgi:hypothetical protein
VATDVCDSDDSRVLKYRPGDYIRVLATFDTGWWIGEMDEHGVKTAGLFKSSATEASSNDGAEWQVPASANAANPQMLQMLRNGSAPKSFQHMNMFATLPQKEIFGDLIRSVGNALYIYPQTVGLWPKKKNLAIRVCLYNGAEACGSAQAELTCVHARSRICSFVDEIRVELPITLTESHYLRLDLIHVHMDSKKYDRGAGTETELGHAALRLMDEEGLLISDGAYVLPIDAASAPSLPSGPAAQYLRTASQNTAPSGLENAPPSMTLRLKSASCIQTQHAVIHDLLQVHGMMFLGDEVIDEKLIQHAIHCIGALCTLESAKQLLKWPPGFRIAMDIIFSLISSPFPILHQPVFNAALHLVAAIRSISGNGLHHSPTLKYYVEHNFDLAAAAGELDAPALCRNVCVSLSAFIAETLSLEGSTLFMLANSLSLLANSWIFYDGPGRPGRLSFPQLFPI